MNVRSLLLILTLCSFSISAFSQSPVIEAKPSGGKYTLSLNPEPPPPVRTAGASAEPEWMYFWEFGDGHYSEEKKPLSWICQNG